MPRLSVVRACRAALAKITYHTCLPLLTLHSLTLHSLKGGTARHRIVMSNVIKYLFSALCAKPLYIGHIYVIIYTTYI